MMTIGQRDAIIKEAKKTKEFSPALLELMQQANEGINEEFRAVQQLRDSLHRQRFALQCACPHPEESINPPFPKEKPPQYLAWLGSGPHFCKVCNSQVVEDAE